MKKLLLWPLALSLALSGVAQDKEKGWDVENPPGESKEIRIKTDEGTWMNLDVSPDGKKVVFDMLGDIYVISVAGGKARLLKGGMSMDVQPRFSPDGRHISFTSDAGGGDNVWIMNSDGSDARQVTKENFRLLNNAEWMPDGQYLVARKHFTSGRSLGAGELWLYHIKGGSGVQLTKRKNDQQDAGEPAVSPDGKYVYFSEDMSGGSTFEYNKDPNGRIYVIRRVNTETGKVRNIISGPGGAVRPQISPDGRKIAFVRRVRTKSVLFVHDLKTGEEYPVYDGLSKDQQEAWAIFGVYTCFDWMPDNQNVIIWSKGKIVKIDTETGKATPIPFNVDVRKKVMSTVKNQNAVLAEKFDSKMIRQAKTSPDGKWLVFNAVGHIWKKKLPNGKPVRLTDDTEFEFEPNFSADGKWLVYVSWDDEKLGEIRKLDLTDKNSKPAKITSEKGFYRTPTFSPDGKKVAYRKDRGNDHMGFNFTKNPGLYYIDANGGESFQICEEGEYPAFDNSGERIYYMTGGYLFGSLKKGFHSIGLDGKDKRTHFTSKYANQFAVSPDGKKVAFSELHKVYLAPFPKTGKGTDLSHGGGKFPVVQVAEDAGTSLHWSAKGENLHWTLGGEYFTVNAKDRLEAFGTEKLKEFKPEKKGQNVGLTLKADIPEGKMAFTNARIITMDGDKVIENGILVVDGNKIVAVGEASATKMPSDAKVIDCSGKTIMPGIVDSHAHLGTFRYGMSPQQQWSYFANLAYGVTTTHDPSSNSEMVFSQSEMVKTGTMVGPRIFSTGTILYGADGDFKAVINNLDDARSAVYRTKALGAFSVKSYNQPRRDQRQQVLQASRELGINVYPEGGSTFFANISQVIDGHTGIEHNLPIAPLFDDVIQLWSEVGTAYTPTLIVNYGGNSGEYYWYQHTDVWGKERLLKFMPRGMVDSRSRRVTLVPEEEYENGHILTSKSCKALSDAGVRVNLGAHGQLQGLGAHWELWMLEQGGMTPLEAIRSATLNGAVYLGMDSEIGSLEVGKLADLIIMDKNPLDDIRNSESVRYTMVNGRLYDCETMNEIGNYDKKRGSFYWEGQKYNRGFEWHSETNSFMPSNCGCGRH
ncbi:bifunctional TolB-family protein/amidohydrolase (plasmid) [Fulvitalea axinellae]|uniref:Bifunctional TolB-family protein/amidohydrolase n=1 Tax=Fulvitalea axinellae TaxID=1182444 RepID=A0AAU9CU38_9BACT|nr:bifunctional TolB-family protein/amidohydrolase [Fulvitalea axinellae]